MNRQQQQMSQQSTQQSTMQQQQQQQVVQQQSQQQISSQQRVSRTEQHVTRQFTTQQTVQGGGGTMMVQSAGGFPPNASPPIFEQIFRNARFAQGGDALFEGKVRGNPKPTVSWTRKGAPLIESNKYKMSYNEINGIVTLLINHIGPGDEGEYTCTAKNQYGEAICSVYIQPEGMPQLQPLQKEYAQTIESTEQRTSGTTQGSSFQRFQQSTQKSSYSNGNSTSIEEDFKVDTFEYRLLREVSFRESITRRFVNEIDIQMSTVVERSLGPPAPPQIAQKPRNSKLLEGSDAVFTAKVAANPKPRLTWFRNGQRVVQNDKFETNYSNQQATLRVSKASNADSGHYTLLAENPQGCVVSSAYLAIEPVTTQEGLIHESTMVKSTETTSQTDAGKALAPNFVRVCNDRDVTEGKMTRFDCRVTGRPYPEVTWFINDRQVSDDATHKILVNESGNHALMITNVSRIDCGIVTCVARNKAGETSFQCNLNVIEKEQMVAPKFVERFSTVNVKEGEPVVLNARAVGTPGPRITWQKDGVPIAPGPDVRISTDSGASTLEIHRAKASDAAWYQCTAQNVAGSTATRARLFVETPKGSAPEPRRLNLPRPTKVIEPEPTPGPEVIYLRHVERAKPHQATGEDERVYPPPQFIVPLQDTMQVEGGRVHFEARIEPVGDPTMRVEWFVNGQPLEASSRATVVFRFGFIALDLISIVMRDSGEYVCRVTSATGCVESRANLSVNVRASIEQTSQHPDSLQYIQQLEDYTRYQRTESVEETSAQRPQFIRPLQDLGELQEGRNAHFEAQLSPVSDPTMKVEWYKDGRPITASSRITTIFNFGYVSLNIMHLRAEDEGQYTVRAVNRLGEAISSSTLRVYARTSVTGDLGIPEQQRYIEKVEELEAYQEQLHKKYVEETPESMYPPEFKSPIKDQHGVREGGFAHFEARLEPTGDSTLKVEWLKDGRPVEASSRITTFFNFGYVALTIKQVTIHDVGNYTCRAYNAIGQAITTAQLSVVSKKDIVFDSQHPGGLQKIQVLEDSSRFNRQQQEEVQVTQAPRFLGPLKGTNKIVEGQRAHFEARVEPQSDLSMKIEWYHNGKPIQTANRIQTYHDFGYVALDIMSVRGDDAGQYTVVARNALGEAQLSTTMIVETRASIDTSSMHRGTYDKTQHLEESKFVEPQYHIEEISKSKPIFVQPLSDPKPVGEGKNIHLECRLEPMGDPTMRVEWFCNGKPITVGSRFRTYYDFGFVAIDIIHTTALDSGEYTVRATNHLGSAHTSACVRIISRSDIITDSQNESAMEQIQMLEDSSRNRRTTTEDVTVQQAPQFTRPLHNIETIEGTNIHMECRLQPIGDPTMRVDWFVNGHPVKTGHRFRPAYEFDYVALDLLSVYPIDSGVYTCQARNQLGEAVTSCSVRVIAKKDLLMESQHHQSLEKIQYLEDASRYKRSEYMDETITIKPRFVTKPKSLENMREGQHAHFECKLEPVTDSNLKVEWYKNGRPITVGHRFRPIHDFGYVALDVIDLIAEDSGVYTCRAVNMIGSDETQCSLGCRGTQQILTGTQNEQGLQQIQHLEDRSRHQRSEYVEETTKQAPTFTTSLKNINIKESQRAHFECRLIPVSDPTMKVEWYHNNKPVKSGSRFTETNNFGFVALDILYCYPEDSGTYTCRAVNALGEAVTSSVCVVQSKKSIYLESQHTEALSRLQYLEDSSRNQRQTVQEETVAQAPVFTMPIRDLRVAENQAAHFEARLIPVGDAKLKVEWLRNGVAIQASNRCTTMHDFGYVALNMKYVNPEDSGTYTCRAINELGEAVTSATLFCQSKASLELESQHEGALQKLRQLEDSSKYQRREEEDITVTQAPNFTTKLNGPTKLVEAQSAHYECRIEPYPDPSLKVEWYHNGKPLQTGHRFRTAYDFGFASLDILTVYAEDSGEYTCRAVNRLGQAKSSINLNVTSKAGIIRETQHEGALQKIQHLEDDSRNRRVAHEDAVIAEKPQFGRPLKNVDNLPEGKSAHLEATLTPVNDPTMKVEWYCNGRPIPNGHRFKTTYDFGFVALDILYAYAEDSGTYMCKARNAVGEAITTAAVNVVAKSGLYLDTMDEDRLKKIRELENYERPQKTEVEPTAQRPVFLTQLGNLEHLKESDHAHLECRVEPINDPNLKIEWFVNGVAIRAGHRFRTTHDFGYVALDILYTYGEDSGTYMCKATNLVGEAVNTCTIKTASRRSILLDTHHPEGLDKIRELEAQGHPTRLEIEEPIPTAPRFVTELRGTTEVYEGATAHFEAQIEPIHDSNLRIEFYHNGKPLPSASRFHITFDFGYVSLDITHCVPEDAGEYSVKAINNLGQCTSSISMRVIAKDSIILESQRPEGLEKIRQLEDQTPYKRTEIPDAVTRQRPVFTQPLQNIDSIVEGKTAHFECRVIPVGDPTLKVEWFRNEKPLETSSRITKVHDFGFVSLDISHVRDEDEGVYMCRASNPLGEAVTTASMHIKTKASIQMETQHPEGMKRIQQLEQHVDSRSEEPERVFEKPIFTQLLTGPSELWEGQHAHFEARVVPVGDPTMRFEWYVNGVELKLGSRFKVTHDFGYVTLDINSTVTEDAGVYMCKAINKAGEAVSSTAMKVRSRAGIVGEPLHPDAWQKIQLKEAEMNKVPEMFVDTTPQQAPVFTTHLKSFDKLVEGQHVYLEAQVEPRADPNLRVEWYKNGISLTTGTRIRSTFDFGLVTLSINGLRGDDSAIYTCKAVNLLGEAVSTCTLKIEDKHWLLGQTLHPDALPKLEALEQPTGDRPEAPEATYDLPVFITHLNNVVCAEGETVHFECHVEPSKDPTLGIEWFVNGKPLQSAARFKSTYDFGYVALDINHSYEEDSGIYTCKATNSKGSATTSGSLRCTSKANIFLDTQHPQGKAGLEAVQDAEEAFLNKYKRQSSGPDSEFPKPVWTIPLNPEFKLGEAEPLHLEATVEPKEDPNLKIEWYLNGKALDHGSRFKMTNDFGFVTLDLTDVYERDQGVYTCKAWNKAGEAFTSTTIYCSSKANLIERTQHPKGKEGLEAIQDLEDALNRQEAPSAESDEGQAPVFTSQFTNLVNLSEGEIAHFEAGLTPTGDQTMVVEWFYNGKILKASHRTRTVHAFGMVVLEILGTKIEDSGTYTCRATNKWGKAELDVKLECVDKSKGQKPRFTTQIQSVEGLKDGQSAHFECTLEPVGDPHMKVEWFHNSKPLLQSTRIKSVSDFGFVVMDISYIQNHDSGEYICKASNKYGEDYTKATISAHGKGGVYLDSLQPDSLARIRELESMQGQKPQATAAPVTEPPVFTTQISDITKLVEGQSAHFEARLTPVNDPDLVVEWYYNGKKLPHGHRYRTFHDFGIVILDILYCYEENSGTYECRAVNKYGQDSTKATMKCISKANLILDSQLPRGMEGGLEKIQNLEDSHIRNRDEKTTEEKGKAPVFTVPLSNIDSLREGENAHFEARLIPTDDPKLKVEWYWNGKPLRTGSRFRTFCDFGFVILEISPVYPEDSGEYSCRAFNDYGEAVTTASMKVSGKRSIILESQLPKGMEGTIDKIAELEGLGAMPSQMPQDDDTGKPPEFITTPADLTLAENSLAHFECRLQPINDSSMRVEWFHNGKSLSAGSRIKTINDFGFVILEVAGCYQRDSGLYTCKATNKHGEATVSCKLQVRGRQGIILEPQLPSKFRTGTESIQKLEESLYKKEEILTEDEKPNPPRFTVELKDNVDVPEGGPVHFDCRVEPINDSSMRIDWFHNGRPFATGSRVHMLNDFGFIAMDIDYTYGRDSGEYICRATNKWGSATTKATVTCKSKRNIDFDSQLPSGMSAEKLRELERGPVSDAPKEDLPMSPPRFITQIESVSVEENDSVRFECRVEPKEDPKLRIEWYRNGKLLPSGHRYRTVYDMGFVSLDILYVYAEDSGEYVCRAVNDLGEDFTKATVSCRKLPSIILQNQVPKGMKKSETLMQMEAALKKYTSEIHLTEDDLYDVDKKQPPRFITQIKEQTSLIEMESTKFECQLAPVGDPNMKVEWFFNGKPLLHKNRFTPIYDFGYVAMNFGWVYPEDSGEYLCRATNLYGMDETRAIIKTAGKPGIIYESQLPKGMKSIEKIREMEAAWQVAPDEVDEEAKPRQAPVFVSKPEVCTVEEGEWARYCCRVTGHPRPRVMWLINGHTVANGSRYKLTYDGMYHLDIPKTRQYDTGKVEVLARNSCGESIAETELKVIPRHDDYRGVLKNSPRPWYDFELTQYQKERHELEKIFDERQATLAEQGGPEYNIDVKSKMYKQPEADWQRNVKEKKGQEYYNKLQHLENDQVTKEIRLRESTHQFAIPGDKIVNSSVAKGMAQRYEESLDEKTEERESAPIPTLPRGQTNVQNLLPGDVLREIRRKQEDEAAETALHGREVHVTKQKQTQKETVGDLEITRKITATETTDVEHKSKTQERVVQGQVLPSTPPVFTHKIKPCRAFENDRARFEVEFDGDPIPKITWFREDFPITSSPDFQIHTMSTKSILVLRQVFMEDSAVFSVVAENRGGTAKCSANLVVQERRRQGRSGVIPPSFLTTIQSTNVNSGQLVRFDARITGTKPLDVYWLKNGKKITPDIRYKTLEEDEVYTLLIIEVVPEDSGKYECVVMNNGGEARCDAECVITAPSSPTKQVKPTTPGAEKAPIIVEPLKDQTIREGQAVAFKCKIVAKPVPQIKWQKGDKIIKPSKYFQMQKDGDFYTLKVTEAFPEDEGVYKCVATNPAGSVTVSANLKVLAPDTQDILPSLTKMKDVTVMEGGPAQFKTQVSGKPKPTIQWLRDGFLIPESPDFQMIHEGNNAVLLIATTYEEDSGTFICRATTSAGQVEQSAKLIVKKRLGPTYRTPVINKKDGPVDLSKQQPDFSTAGTNEQTLIDGIGSDRSNQPIDAEALPLGDETLPWRRNKISVLRIGKHKVQQQQVVEDKYQPWTAQKIELKKAPRERKEIQKETLEEVQLKHSKTEKRQLSKEELERVDLKHRFKVDQSRFAVTEDESITSIRDDTMKLYSEEDTSLLDYDESEETTQKQNLQSREWRKTRKEDTSTLKTREQEDNERLEIDETDTLETRAWRRGRKPETEKTRHEEDNERLDVEETEDTKTEDIKTADTAETKSWRRPKKTEETTEIVQKVQEAEPAKFVIKKAPIERKEPEQPKTAVPWNQTEISLKKTRRESKEIRRESLPVIELKPTKVIRKEIPREELEQVDLKRVSKVQKEITEKEVLETTEDINILTLDTQEIQKTEEESQTISWRKPRRQSEEQQTQNEVKQVPWTQESVQLKRAPKERKELPKETLETVQLKPTRRESKEIQKETLEEVSLKPIKKATKMHEEDTEILDFEETNEATANWRKPRKEIIQDQTIDKREETEDTNILTIDETVKTEEDLKSISWRKPRRPSEEQSKELTQIPWTQEPIKLKKAPKEKKESPKQILEAVSLKPTRRESKEIPKESLEEVYLKPIKKTNNVHEEDTEILDLKEITKETEIDNTKTTTWRKPRKESIIETVAEEQTVTEEVETIDEKKPEEIKQLPWTQETIKLKKSPKENKNVPKETLEQIQLKPTRRESKEIPKPVLENVALKPLKKQSQPDIVQQENTDILEVERVAEEIAKPEEQEDEQPSITQQIPKVQKPRAKSLKQAEDENEIPWNKQAIQLKRAPKPTKELSKDEVEEILLKPVKKGEKTTEIDATEQVELKPIQKPTEKPKSFLIEETVTEIEDTIVLKVDEDEEKVEKSFYEPTPIEEKKLSEKLVDDEAPWRRIKKEQVPEEVPEEKQWPTGKRRSKEVDVQEEITLTPIPKDKKEVEDKTVVEKTWRRGKKVEKPEETPTEMQWPTGKRRPKETEEKEDTTLKPILKDKTELKDKPDEEKTPWKRGKKEEIPEEVDEKQWPSGKRRPKEVEKSEEIALKPIPKQKIEPQDKPVEEKSPWKRGKKEEILEEVPEKIQWPTGKRRPKEPEEKEEIVLKPISKDKEKEQPLEEIPSWRRNKKEKKPEEVSEERQWPTGKRRPKEPEEKEDIVLKPISKDKKEIEDKPDREKIEWKPESKAKPEDIPEDVQWSTGKRSPKEPEKKKEITLKPISKPEKELVEKPIEEKAPMRLSKKEEKPEEVPEEMQWPKGKRCPKEPEEKEEVHLKPISKEKPEEELVEVKAPWRRGKKEEIPEEIPEQVKWPTGKRRPKEPEDKEEVVLKPIPKEQKVLEEKPVEEKAPWRRGKKEEIPEEVPELKQWPTGKRRPIEPEEKEEILLKPISKEKKAPEDIPVEEKTQWKRGKKDKKPEDLFEEKYMPVGKRRPLESEQKEVIQLKPVPKEQEAEIKKPHEEDLKPIMITDIPTEDEKVEEEILSQAQITFKPKQKQPEKKPVVKEEKVIEQSEEVQQAWQNDVKVDMTSKKITKEVVKTTIIEDSDRPLPDLEIISQKRHREIVDRVAEEPVIEDTKVIEDRTSVRQSIVQKSETKIKITERRAKAPRFIDRLQPLVSEPNKPNQLICTVEGSPFPEIKWFKNEVEMQASERVTMTVVENTAVLNFAEIQPQDVAVYSCKAMNTAGVAVSTANLIILEKEEDGTAPHFIQPLQPKIVDEDTIAILECKVIGTPTPTVKWYRGNEEVKPTKNHKIEYYPETGTATLEILKPTSEDQTIFKVRADNKFGRAECRANLILERAVTVTKPVVMHAPKIIIPLNALIAKPDKQITMEAEFDGQPEPEVNWFRNGKEITPTDDFKIQNEKHKTTLKISKKAKQKSGKYEIRAKNPAGEARTSGSVTITEDKEMEEVTPPKFIKHIKPEKVGQGEVIILEAVVESIPEASFQWFQDSRPLKASPGVRIVTSENKSVLLLQDVIIEQAGSYTVRAENVGGSATVTASVNIIEEEDWEEITEFKAPKFERPLIPLHVMDGEKVKLKCIVQGKPIPKVEWFHNNQPVREAQDVVISQDSEGVCMLAIQEVFPENAGDYTCYAINKVGEAICTASLLVEAYEYVPDSEIGVLTGPSGSEEDLIDKTISEVEILSDIEMESAPKIVKKLPEVISTKDGDITRLEVKAVGKPKPIGKWLKQGVEIISCDEFMIENFEDGTSVLTISEVYPDDTGEIVFEAHNPLGVAITVAELSVEGIIGTKEYRKPEWVTHMEELQAALKATQCVPTFVQEIKDVRAKEEEAVSFECMFSGTPTPDVVWLRDDKLIRNTENLKIRIQDTKTTLTIKHATIEDIGTYTCKATSDIGLAVTKAKLYVQEIPEYEKKAIIMNRAKQEEEKTKLETVTMEQKKEERKKKRSSVTTEIEKKKPLKVEEVTLIETTEKIEETTEKKRRAKPVVPIQEPVATSAIATMKKIDTEVEEVVETREEQANVIVSQLEPVTVSTTVTEDTIQDIKEEKKPKQRKAKTEVIKTVDQRASVSEVQVKEVVEKVTKIKIVEKKQLTQAVEQTLEFIKAREFGPGESPLRELAEIGFLFRRGITVNDVTVLYHADQYPSLKTPEAQSAMVNLVERRGHGALISQVLAEETTSDERLMASMIGFRAFMKMVELKHATVEEVIVQFAPEDFMPHAWESTETTEVVSKDRVSERVQITKKTEVHTHVVEEKKHIKKVKGKREDETEETLEESVVQEKSATVKTGVKIPEFKRDVVQITELPVDESQINIVECSSAIVEQPKEETSKVVEEEEEELIVVDEQLKIGKQKVKKTIQRKSEEEVEVEIEYIGGGKRIIKKKITANRPDLDEEIIEEEFTDKLLPFSQKSERTRPLMISSQMSETMSLRQVTGIETNKPVPEKSVKVAMLPHSAVTQEVVHVEEKEIDSKDSKKMQAFAERSLDIIEPYQVTEPGIQIQPGKFDTIFKPDTTQASQTYSQSESIVVSEIHLGDSITKLDKEITQESQAKMTLFLQEATKISQTESSQSEVAFEKYETKSAQAEKTFTTQEGISVYEVTEGQVEDNYSSSFRTSTD